jgi:cell division control protein 6
MERQVIKDFVLSLLRDDKEDTTTLYISGSPGTGKTALVNSVLCEFQSDVVSINCMALNSVDELWDRMVEELDGKKGRGKKAKGREAVLKALGELDGKW